MQYNFKTDKVVIVGYPMGAGGKFLINCLGVSNGACLQDWDLYDLTSAEKKELILDRLENTPAGTWNDLDLGCFKQFENNLDGMTAEEIHAIKWEFTKLLDISNGDKYYFQATHDEQDYVQLTHAFPNARTINFIKCSKLKRHMYSSSTDLDIESEFVFNVNNYNDVLATTTGILTFYKLLKLDDFDYDFVSEYYTKWKAHIT